MNTVEIVLVANAIETISQTTGYDDCGGITDRLIGYGISEEDADEIVAYFENRLRVRHRVVKS